MNQIVLSSIVALIAGAGMMGLIPVMLLVERRGSAWLQRRSGPNRVGPFGLFQPIADSINLIFKEENIPARAHKVLFILAPALGVLPPFLALSAIPLAGSILIDESEYAIQVANFNVGLLFVLAISSLHVYSILTAGWASNNKFSLMGALRASSQKISYEIAIGISIVSLVLVYGTLDLREIVKMQEAGGALPAWGCFLQPVAFLILWVCSFAETNRLPFDLPEGETELVAGYHTEYSGLKFALFFLGEYAAMGLASAFLATLFLGGYNVPFFSEATLRAFFAMQGSSAEWASWLTAGAQLFSLLAKIGFFMWVFVWIRWTLPRFRYDQLMNLGWKVLLPLGLVNLVATLVVTFFLGKT